MDTEKNIAEFRRTLEADVFEAIRWAYDVAPDKDDFINRLRKYIHNELSEHREQPIDLVQWIPIDMVEANDYNPNSVANIEMNLLYVSINNDGYTQPVVVIFDKEKGKYVIVDGAHRTMIMKVREDIRERNHGMLPCVVINKSINDRMASTP